MLSAWDCPCGKRNAAFQQYCRECGCPVTMGRAVYEDVDPSRRQPSWVGRLEPPSLRMPTWVSLRPTLCNRPQAAQQGSGPAVRHLLLFAFTLLFWAIVFRFGLIDLLPGPGPRPLPAALRTGMTRAEVRRLAGNPDRAVTGRAPGRAVWYYERRGAVVFRNGRVVRIDRY